LFVKEKNDLQMNHISLIRSVYRPRFRIKLLIMFMKPERLNVLIRCKPGSSMTKSLQKCVKKILKSSGSVDSGTARAILQIRA